MFEVKINTVQTSLINRSADVFLAGCSKEPKCPECHNPALWDFNNGVPADSQEAENMLIKRISSAPSLIEAVRIMGGEPADQKADSLYRFLSYIKSEALADRDIELWVFTGWEIGPFLIKHARSAEFIDFIKTGPYVKGLDSKEYVFDKRVSATGKLVLASCNQKVYMRGAQGFDEVSCTQSL